MKEISRRREEALASYRDEGTRHEQAYLIEGRNSPILIYVAEVEDVERARQAFLASKLPIDLQHRETMREAVAGRLEPELLFECAVENL
jgi:hypothetical protein